MRTYLIATVPYVAPVLVLSAVARLLFGLRARTAPLAWLGLVFAAVVLLFGRVPQDRQVWLAVLTFGSLAWVALAAGVLLPDVGTLLLAAVPRPPPSHRRRRAKPRT